jgi:hypothetical protein
MNERYSYTEHKFALARRYLMLPPRGKEALAISAAVQECRLGLQNIAHLNNELDDRSRDYISKLTELMEKKEKKSFSDNDKQELCDSINHLAYYFHDRWKEV